MTCPVCIHDAPGRIVCKKSQVRTYSQKGIVPRLICDYFEDMREHIEFQAGGVDLAGL